MDGLQCEDTCCNGMKSPPWFSVQLPAPTTDMIEVCICRDQRTNDEDTPVELFKIYVHVWLCMSRYTNIWAILLKNRGQNFKIYFLKGSMFFPRTIYAL